MILAYVLSTRDRATARWSGLMVGALTIPGILIAGPISGGALNPARHLGSAFFAGWIHSLWIYMVGPITGAVAAVLTVHFGLSGEPTPAQGFSEQPDDAALANPLLSQRT
jgi:glycerol uptake facilitator-like aquaporin